MTRLVSQFYDIEDHEIKKLADTKEPYWMKVRDFWWSVKEREAEKISSAQANWLSKIEAELTDYWRPKWMQEEGAEQEEF